MAMLENKENIRPSLLQTGRELVETKGSAYLTARKLSEASGYSVGTIYNQFANMDNFIASLNMETLEELYTVMSKVMPTASAYRNLNAYLEVFTGFVLANSNRWFLLYDYHLKAKELSPDYRYMIIRLLHLWEPSFNAVFARLGARKRRLARQVLWLTLFSLSSFLTTNIIDGLSLVNKKSVCQLLLNTYLAGLAVLRKG